MSDWETTLARFADRLDATGESWRTTADAIRQCIVQEGADTAPTPERACSMLRTMAELKAEFYAGNCLDGFGNQLARQSAAYLAAAKLVDGGL